MNICICVFCYSSRLVVYVPSISSIVLIGKIIEECTFSPFGICFLPCDPGLEFYISLRENSINQ